jgi:hypothetical protein
MLSSEFNASFDPKLTALEHDRSKVTPKMVEHPTSCTPQLAILIFRKNNSGHNFHSSSHEKSEQTVG